MKNRWNEKEAMLLEDPLELRVYTSRLLGQDSSLVMHGGGNTSVKKQQLNFWGETEEVLFVKGSGWDLETITSKGFAPVLCEKLLKMANFEHLSDSDMVHLQKLSMTEPSAPAPSVEAILHAILPFRFVDHTHADAVVTLSNTLNGKALLETLYLSDVLVLDYVMPGFLLAKQIQTLLQSVDIQKYKGVILMHHGVFTFADTAKESYEAMIEIVGVAKRYMETHSLLVFEDEKQTYSLEEWSEIRHLLMQQKKEPLLVQLHQDIFSQRIAKHETPEKIFEQGTLTPDHVIRIKPFPWLHASEKDLKNSLEDYIQKYTDYFESFSSQHQKMLDPLPKWGVWNNIGTFTVGSKNKELSVQYDIVRHTLKAIFHAENLGGWKTISRKELFEMEYWELEQAKLKLSSPKRAMEGQIVFVTGAASGIGKACVEFFEKEGACILALDLSEKIHTLFESKSILPFQGDVCSEQDIAEALSMCLSEWGGLDCLVSNAGNFPMSATIEKMDSLQWEKSLALNLTSHQRVLQQCIPFLKKGWNPAVVFVGSKNVGAPGPGAAAYSCAKAGLTQLARVAALELSQEGIRVQTVHPDAVFDTGIWDEETLRQRAQHYKLSVEEYQTKNCLKQKITSQDVAEVIFLLCHRFLKTTGAQIPVDGGNDRII